MEKTERTEESSRTFPSIPFIPFVPLSLCFPDQNVSLNANCQLRASPFVEVIVPNAELVRSVFGLAKLTLFHALKTSARSCALNRSVTAQVLVNEKSQRVWSSLRMPLKRSGTCGCSTPTAAPRRD